jgi:hypothetical protein
MRLRRTRLLNRRVNVRDASLFVIATEGSETERRYFDGFESSRVHVETLPTGLEGSSSPDAVLERLEEFRDRYDLGGTDQLWLVVDVDRWGDRKLRDVCRDARGRFATAVSNPCFELWLYLHFFDAADLSGPEWDALVPASGGNRSRAMERRLRARLLEREGAGYDKATLTFARFRTGIGDAIARARALDTDPAARWPQAFPGTHVYRLAEELAALLPPEG